MKKILLTALTLLIGCSIAFSQTKISLKASPTINTGRVTKNNSADYGITSTGAPFKFVIGPVVDVFFDENYAFNTGILFSTNGYKLQGTHLETNQTFTENYDFQYIQIPLTIKLFSNEIANNTKIYTQLGGNFDIKINDNIDSNSILLDKASWVDIDLLIGLGMEYTFDFGNAIFAGISYQRGLINNRAGGEDFTVKNDVVSFDIGFTF
ncbi:porin family protein [Aureibacter tunicatorum]|uniref:Outer membrane protein beta-barrel domain-containing protein n=1 Tax=Aureibacter tunicatorum TaxID=866807 RepID=A0AAE3XUP0_9BACT|nr:porin family protein [Aureibacter tunicatorum]MDR6242059.1 hypothetical protein [Aureibacter tunicatorum]BDD03634.1 hypothetical protein AUTU_11170 [Aureibacter tunicatorum]